MRPSLPLSRAEIDLSGRPDRPDAGVCPGIALSMMAASGPLQQPRELQLDVVGCSALLVVAERLVLPTISE